MSKKDKLEMLLEEVIKEINSKEKVEGKESEEEKDNRFYEVDKVQPNRNPSWIYLYDADMDEDESALALFLDGYVIITDGSNIEKYKYWEYK